MRDRNVLGTYLTLLGLLGATACGDDNEPAPPDPLTTTIELVGNWDDNYGGAQVITAAKWGTADIREFDNAANSAIVQNPADDAFNPSKFAKYVWTTPAADRSFYYCTVDFALATLADARASTKTADAANPETGGCGGFAWTRVMTPLEVKGTYDSSFGGMETVTSTSWGGTPIAAFSNDKNYAVTQNPADSPFGANLFNKIVWTEPSAGTFHYCFVDFGRATRMEAETSTQTADATDPDAGGCGMFSWTKLSR